MSNLEEFANLKEIIKNLYYHVNRVQDEIDIIEDLLIDIERWMDELEKLKEKK